MNLIEVRSTENLSMISDKKRYWLDEDSKRMVGSRGTVADLFCDPEGSEELGTFQVDTFKAVTYVKCPICNRTISTLSPENVQREQIHCECRDWTYGHTLLFKKNGIWYHRSNPAGKMLEAEVCKNRSLCA